jgi:dTDP-4-amino-4,6-dideoxy-D-galactose acyltransferase
MPSRFSPDAWLGESLGRPAFRLVPGALEEGELLRSQMSALSQHGDAFFYARVPTSEVQACIRLTAAGFGVVDTGITLARGPGTHGNRDIRVAVAKASQHEAIPVIGERCFRWSRFHLDPKIPTALANVVKRRWLESYVQGARGAALYAAAVEGQVAGFLAALESSSAGRRVAIIDLLGVAPEHQRKGLGAALVQFFISEWQGSVSELRVGTQAANVDSLRLYESCGFRVAESSYVLHAHYRDGKLLP